MTEDRLLSTVEAGALLKVGARRVLWYIERGRLPAQRIAGRWVLRESDLTRLQRRPPGRPAGWRKKGAGDD